MKLAGRRFGVSALLVAALALGGCRHGGDGDVAQVRLINAVPEPNGLSVSVDHHSVWKHSAYQNNTGYRKVRPGTYSVQVQAGDSAASKDISFQKKHNYTVLALKAPQMSFRVFPDARHALIPAGKSQIAFINAAAVPGGVDVLVNNIVAFPHAAFAHRTDPMLLNAGSYQFQVNVRDSVALLAGPVNMQLQSGHSYTLVVMGRRKTGLTLEVYPDQN